LEEKVTLEARGGGGNRGNKERRERKKISCRNRGEETDFLAGFAPDLLYAQTMKSIPIYRGWKGVISSSLAKTFGS
jgi:hypothetical protein